MDEIQVGAVLRGLPRRQDGDRVEPDHLQPLPSVDGAWRDMKRVAWSVSALAMVTLAAHPEDAPPSVPPRPDESNRWSFDADALLGSMGGESSGDLFRPGFWDTILDLSANGNLQATTGPDSGDSGAAHPSGVENRSANVMVFPSLAEFRQSVHSGVANQLSGIYASGLMDYPIVNQPGDQYTFVSDKSDEVTQFELATQYNTIGLLAHNELAGSAFFALEPSKNLILVYGDGSTRVYQITQVLSYQALTPDSPYSSFVDLSDPTSTLSVEQVFYKIYASGNPLVLQTCIAKDGEPNWGRLFVIAYPVAKAHHRGTSFLH